MKTLYDLICKAEAAIAGAFLILMVALIFLGGVARMMHVPLNWTTDVATCLFAWACFLCADVAWRRDALMSIELVTERLTPERQRLLVLVNLSLIALFLLFVIGSGFWLSWVSRARSFQGMPGVSYSLVTMSLPVGGLLLLTTTCLKLRDELRGRATHRAHAL